MALPAIGSVVFTMFFNNPMSRTWVISDCDHFTPVFARVKSHHVTKQGTFAKVEELDTQRVPGLTTFVVSQHHPSPLKAPYAVHAVVSPGDLRAGGRTWKIRETPPSEGLRWSSVWNGGARHRQCFKLRGKAWVSGRIKYSGTEVWFGWTPQTRVAAERVPGSMGYSHGHAKKVAVLKALRNLPANVVQNIMRKSRKYENRPPNDFSNKQYTNWHINW